MGIKKESNKEKDKSNGENKYYNINCQIGSNINNYKFANSPRYIFDTSIRDLQKKNKEFKINERYLKYSSFGEQIMTQKNSRPIYSFGKQERFNLLIFFNAIIIISIFVLSFNELINLSNNCCLYKLLFNIFYLLYINYIINTFLFKCEKLFKL